MNTCLRPEFLLSFANGGRTFCHIQTNPLLRLWRSKGTFNKIGLILSIIQISRKMAPFCDMHPSISQSPVFRMPKWWPEFVRVEAALNETKDVTSGCDEQEQHGELS